jgi:N6-adenosine-specific RNA methylase IME4
VKRYRTIVADPPWEQNAGSGYAGRVYDRATGRMVTTFTNGKSKPLPYRTMSVEEIATLPVGDMAMPDAHVYMWVTNRYVREAYPIMEAWGFRPVTLLTWAKAPMGMGLGGAFVQTTEHILFGRRGRDVAQERAKSTWWAWKRPFNGGPVHSAKPDGFLDLVEQVSPGPYLEMFARRARFGWDYFGDESLGTAEMVA